MNDLRARLADSVGGMERLAGFYSARTFGDLSKRAEREIEDAALTIEDAIRRTEKAIADAGLQEFHSADDALERVLIRAWAMYQHAGSRTANWMITGPARFPVRQNEKRMNTEHKRYNEFSELAAKAPLRAVKIARAKQKAQLGAGGLADQELADLRKRLEERELLQRRMKATNEVIRRNKLGRDDADQLAELMAARGFPTGRAMCHSLLTPDYGSAGFASYQLSNNNAEIHRLQARVRQVEAKVARIEAAPDEPAERIINGVRIVEDSADDRLRLIFDGKPAGPIIQALKSSGFRWSPTNGAWQRQITPNARAAASRVLAVVAMKAQQDQPVLN